MEIAYAKWTYVICQAQFYFKSSVYTISPLPIVLYSPA